MTDGVRALLEALEDESDESAHEGNRENHQDDSEEQPGNRVKTVHRNLRTVIWNGKQVKN